MLPSCRLALRPTLSLSLVVSRTYVARQAKPRLRWWLDFDSKKHGEKLFEEYSKREEKRVGTLQDRVERFRAMRGRSDNLDLIDEIREEHTVNTTPTRPRNWLPPPAELPKDLGYIVKRSCYGQLPVYTYYVASREACKIRIRRVDGDLFLLRDALKKELGLDLVSVNELTGCVAVYPPWEEKFEVKESIEDFLYRKGF